MYLINAVFGFGRVATLWFLLSPFSGEQLFSYVIFPLVILPISNIIMLLGIFLIVFGWKRLFRAKGKLVTTGIYAQTRHPQYLGFLLLTAGIGFLWPTFSTLLPVADPCFSLLSTGFGRRGYDGREIWRRISRI